MEVLDILSSEETCSKLFREIRWRDGIRCPRCGSTRLKGHGNYGEGLKRYRCKTCGRTFNDKTGTPFHYSRLKPEGMVHAHPPLPGPAQLHPQPKLAPGPKLHDHL
ncbi:MAG: transposase [Candidatus Jordarchaeaceae archaeon]